MEFKIGDPSIVETLSPDQLKEYWQELKLARYDSHFYMKLIEKIRMLNPNLVMPEQDVIEKLKNESLALALWEENWENKNRERVKNGGTDYSLFYRNTPVRKLDEEPKLIITANG